MAVIIYVAFIYQDKASESTCIYICGCTCYQKVEWAFCKHLSSCRIYRKWQKFCGIKFRGFLKVFPTNFSYFAFNMAKPLWHLGPRKFSLYFDKIQWAVKILYLELLSFMVLSSCSWCTNCLFQVGQRYYEVSLKMAQMLYALNSSLTWHDTCVLELCDFLDK